MGIQRGVDMQFYIHLFDTFEISDGERVLTAEEIRSDQVSKLVAYLALHRKNGCTARELMDDFWPDGQSAYPAGALKNLMYRLRKILAAVWPGVEFILTGRGSYRWNPELDVRVDVEEMEDYCQRATSLASPEKRTMYLNSAISIYRGKLLSEYTDEYWIIPVQTYYHNRFVWCVRELAKILEKQSDYALLESLCQRAIVLEPLDEAIHCGLLRAYIGSGKVAQARTHYQETVRLYREKLGAEPGDEMRHLYYLATNQNNSQEISLSRIQHELEEGDTREGAFFCEYVTFRRIYGLVVRRFGRQNMPVQLSLLTLDTREVSREGGDSSRWISQVMDDMHRTLQSSLRAGDVVTRYCTNQFLILLPACTQEDAERVMRRISRNYYTDRRSLPESFLLSGRQKAPGGRKRGDFDYRIHGVLVRGDGDSRQAPQAAGGREHH